MPKYVLRSEKPEPVELPIEVWLYFDGGYVCLMARHGETRKTIALLTPQGTLSRPECADLPGLRTDAHGRIKLATED